MVLTTTSDPPLGDDAREVLGGRGDGGEPDDLLSGERRHLRRRHGAREGHDRVTRGGEIDREPVPDEAVGTEDRDACRCRHGRPKRGGLVPVSEVDHGVACPG